MTNLLKTVALLLLLGVGGSLPASAYSSVEEINFRDWSYGARFHHAVPVEQPRAQRSYGARYYDDEEARPRRRAHDDWGYTQKRRHAARHGGKGKIHQAARKSAKTSKVAAHPDGQKTAARPKAQPATDPAKDRKAAELPKGQKSAVHREQPEAKPA